MMSECSKNRNQVLCLSFQFFTLFAVLPEDVETE